MKKLYFMAVAAIAALSSCTSDNDLELNQNTGKGALTFTATIEDSEATRATFDNTNQCAAWDVNDQISINGKTYSAQEAGTTSTFTADGEGATGDTYNAYFPASLYNGAKATLPAIQTYTAGKFNMPMYATSTTTELKFYNLCAVLAIKVTSADIAKLKSIKVASDQKMNGSFTVTDNTAVMGTDGTNAVVLESSEALTLTETGTTFYIAIPAQTYKYLNIFLSADGTTYTQAMATKKAAGLGAIARSTMFNIDYAKNATKLWEGNLFIADCNLGATLATEYGGYYTQSAAANVWASAWRMPTQAEFEALINNCTCTWDDTNKGLLCTSTAYTGNSIFLPAAGGDKGMQSKGSKGCYWSSSSTNYLTFNSSSQDINSGAAYDFYSVRAVLEEATEYPEGSRGTAMRTGDVKVKWVKLWADGPKFAEYNVGAENNNPEDYGGYYSWGLSEGQTYENAENYNKGKESLTGTDDTATNLWGSKWRMPTNTELENLLKSENCTVEWKVNYNNTEINGLLCKGKEGTAYACNSIFLPAAGESSWGNVDRETINSSGDYWSSTSYYEEDDDEYILAYNLGFSSSKKDQKVDLRRRYCGYSVRAVLAE